MTALQVLLISSNDPRKRYRFVQRPLEAAGADCDVFIDSHSGLSANAELRRRITSNNPDVVVLFGGDIRLGLRLAQVRQSTNVPVVLRYGGNPFTTRHDRIACWIRRGRLITSARSLLGMRVTRRSIRRCDGLIVVSKTLKQQLEPCLQSNKPIIVAPPVLELPITPNTTPQDHSDAIRVVAVTNLAYQAKANGINSLCTVLCRAATCLNQTVVFDILGGGEHWRKISRRWHGTHGLLRINCEGMARDIQPFLRSAHLFAYCSQLDSCPLSVIEAQAYGLPIFIGRHSAATDFLTDGTDATMFDPNDPKTAADALVQLLSSPARMKSMQKASHDSAIRRSEANTVGQDLLKFFEQLLGASRGQRT